MELRPCLFLFHCFSETVEEGKEFYKQIKGKTIKEKSLSETVV